MIQTQASLSTKLVRKVQIDKKPSASSSKHIKDRVLTQSSPTILALQESNSNRLTSQSNLRKKTLTGFNSPSQNLKPHMTSKSPKQKLRKIEWSDFWSNKMKVKALKLEKLIPSSLRNSDPNAKRNWLTLPVLEEKFRRSFKNSKQNTARVPKEEFVATIDKIIDNCKSHRKSTRKLTHQMITSSKSIKKDFLKFSKKITK